jgi:hypothetical protein
MSGWPSTVRYLERLVLDENGQPTAIDVEIPSSRSDAFDILSTINRLAQEGDLASWKAAVRQYTACDWYVLGLFMSGAQRRDPFTGRPEMDCDFLWNHYREIQFNGQGKLNTTFRGGHKSHILIYVGATNKVLLNPNRVMAIAAHQKDAAAKHGIRAMLEWENNAELKTAWPDVFFWDPKKDPECSLWNQEIGCNVRRTISSVMPTLSWWAIEHVPTGGRVGDFFFDDLEVEDTVESADQRDKLLRRFSSFKKTSGRMSSVYLNGTSHHPQGLVAHLARSQMYEVIGHAAEDTSKPAPDIAALYDACDGRIMDRETGETIQLPRAVRDVRLDGAPVFHHALELAMMRLDALATPGGLADYYRQMMRDILAGEDKRLQESWIRWYDVDPTEMAEGAYIYITIDASKGVNDPTFARVEACNSNREIAWVGGLRKKIAPSDFGREIYMLCCQWEGLGSLKEVRFEIFGQATWDTHFIQYCETVAHRWPGGLGPLNVKAIGRNKVNRTREWMALEPAYRSGKRLFPRSGIWIEDESHQRVNLVDYYVEFEYKQFPLPITDDGLAADALLFEPEDQKKGIFPLEFPESDEAANLRDALAWRKSRRRGETYEDAGSTWMSDGL